ncbi:hypothetical protein AMELA_G00060280 [Ameiurus melas]|uniref:Uncharacterized protein n=1 Tax=Ameiurus melas TaxID=219545 RepID=A0A7J6B1S5_AMEME|nr:hypothetical protein AMELA_G00060280 [Ameiurus melas]
MCEGFLHGTLLSSDGTPETDCTHCPRPSSGSSPPRLQQEGGDQLLSYFCTSVDVSGGKGGLLLK